MKTCKPETKSEKKADSRLAVNKRGDGDTKPATKNKSKFPWTSYMIFIEEFNEECRKEFNKHCPGEKISDVGLTAERKWKSMSEAEKAPYVAKATKLAEYVKNKNMEGLNAYIHKYPRADPSFPTKPQLPSLCAFNFIMKGCKSETESEKKADSILAVDKRGDGDTKPATKNKSKFPWTSYMIFIEEFNEECRKEFNKHCPGEKISHVGWTAEEKWKSMSEAEKAPYVAEATKLAEYVKNRKTEVADVK